MTSTVPNLIVAEQLDSWFRSIVKLADDSLFSIVPDGPHRSVVVIDVLARNARTALLFKQELDEALVQAGLANPPIYPDSENRNIALGLAINWGIRFLLAYAQECAPHLAVSRRRDLAWVARQLDKPQARGAETGN
jgi:hypothetical protein